MTVDLETRAEAAARAARRAADAAPLPELPTSRRRRRPALALCVLAACGVAAALAVTRPWAGEEATRLDLPGLPFLVADDVPPQLTSVGAAELARRDDIGPVTLWGDATAPDPYSGPIVAAWAAPRTALADLVDYGVGLDVGGHAARVGADPLFGYPAIAVDRGADKLVVVARGISDEELAAIAAAAEVRDDRVVIAVDALPGDAVLSGDLWPPVFSVMFSDPLDPSQCLWIHVSQGTERARLWRGLLTDAEAVDVGGRAGYVGTQSRVPVVVLERDGTSVLISGSGRSRDELIAAARSLRPATEDEVATWTGPSEPPHTES
jgi:hypothetical protein